MSGCCIEHNCRRSKPIRVLRSALSGSWYAVTDYIDRGNGLIEAKTKHRLANEDQETLNRLYVACTDGTR